MIKEKEFDVVLYALQQHRDKLWKMTQQNMNSEFIGMNIMDDIRLKQINKLDEAIKEQAKAQRTWVGLTDEEIGYIAVKSQDGISPRDDTLQFAQAIEAKLKEKNS